VSSPSSRFDGAATYPASVSRGEPPLELYAPRFTASPPAVLQHVVKADDRLDLLAMRYFGDPLQYWRIVDANPTIDPESLLVRGRVLAIPRGV
jgi:nucleoid-associated protein YgaU